VNAKRVAAAAGVLHGSQVKGKRTAAGLAADLEAACMLQSPETAAEQKQLRARVAELEAERRSTNEALDDAVQELERRRDRIAELERSASEYPPAMPWAALMDHEDLADFLDELAASAITHASSEVALTEVEKTCATWRLIAEAQHGHNTAPGPDAMTRTFAPTQALREDHRPSAEWVAETFSPKPAPRDDDPNGLHHTYRVGRDLPPLDGQR